jgi:hypothetical protein
MATRPTERIGGVDNKGAADGGLSGVFSSTVSSALAKGEIDSRASVDAWGVRGAQIDDEHMPAEPVPG